MKLKIWIEALRLKTLPLALGGIVAGFAISQSGNQYLLIWVCITAILLQILSNFANDYGDFVKGTDVHRQDRLLNTGQISKNQMLMAIIFTISLTLISGIIVLFEANLNALQWWVLFGLGIFSIIAAISYTMGKNAYGYKGYGDLFVLLFFGLVAVLGSAFLFDPILNMHFLWVALGYGFLATGVLNINNLRDLEKDKMNQKNTLATTLGFRKAMIYHHLLLVFSALFFWIFAVLESYYSLALILIILLNFVHLNQIRKVKFNNHFNLMLKQLSLGAFIVALSLLIVW
jgi:1,4-dihydroxy-2-naphthoate polyprenyltransferase